ncbi:MAG: hypothetical protein ACOX5Z_05015 [Desulfobulbus sp.]
MTSSKEKIVLKKTALKLSGSSEALYIAKKSEARTKMLTDATNILWQRRYRYSDMIAS